MWGLLFQVSQCDNHTFKCVSTSSTSLFLTRLVPLTETWQNRSCLQLLLIFLLPLFRAIHFSPVFLPLFAVSDPASRLWCVCQQHSCLEQSAWVDICRTASLIWSATRRIGVTKSSSRQSRHRGRRFLCVFGLYASLSLIKTLIAHSSAHTRVFQQFVVSVSGSVCRVNRVALLGWHCPMSVW